MFITVRRSGTLVLAACAVLAGCSKEPTSVTTTTTGSFKSNPCSVTGTLTLTANQTARVDCSNGGTTLTLAGNGASYLVVPELVTDQVPDNLVLYSIASGSLASASVGSGHRLLVSRIPTGFGAVLPTAPASNLGTLNLDGGPGSTKPRTRQHAFDRWLRARARQKLKSGAWRPAAARARVASLSHVRAAVQAPPALGSVRSFRILANDNTNAFTTTRATLAYVGSSVLLYIDSLAPANGFTPAQLAAFGQFFDQTLYPIDTAAFGPPTDIDNNGHVIMLMSQYVNALTSASECQTEGYIAGFFDEEDLGGGPDDPDSNNGEIFYSIVPDPSGQFSCAHTVTDENLDVPATFLHEFQHLIDFGTHVIINGGNPESSWLDEGLSIVAEELGSVYYEQKCPPPSCRTDASQLFPDSSQGFISDALYDSYAYALLPDTASVTLHSDSDDGFSWRGGDWLLMRYLGDQYGGNYGGFYKKLENGPDDGILNMQAATGQPFTTLFANFGLALWVDSLPNLPRTTAPAVNRFVSRNMRLLWSRLYATSGPSAEFPLAMPVQLFPITSDTSSAVLDPGTTTFYRLDTPTTSAAVTIQFSAPGGTALLSVYQPQLAIYRLPSGQ